MPTQKYLVILRSTPGEKREAPSPAQMHEMYAVFNAWKDKFKDSIVDMGAKLKPGGKVATAADVKDGPFVEVKEVIGGYMVVAAESYDAALEVVKGCPGVLGPGTSVELRELSGP